MKNDGKRTYTWTSFGQLLSLDYLSAPALQDLGGIQIYAPSQVKTDFTFDAGGNRLTQKKERIAQNQSSKLELTTYVGAYEKEIHKTCPVGSGTYVPDRTVHRHNIGGFAVYTTTKVEATGAVTAKLTTLLKDHLGSTDVLYTGTWNGYDFASPITERQSFDSWGERRNPDDLSSYRASDGDAFRTSGQDYDRGYTGHEQLDDSGLIHMNGRIYDPELGRMLSPDPYVQVPEYSQNFNRYSYVMNNPLNLTDPSGFSWLGEAFHDVGGWLKENWRTVAAIIVVVIAWYIAPYIVAGFYGSAGIVTTPAVFQGAAGAVAGTIAGGANAAIAGGGWGDILRGAVVGGVQGGVSGGILHGLEPKAAGFSSQMAVHVAGHGVLGGAANVAMGGKFQDGFLSAAASAGAGDMGWLSGATVAERTIKAGIIGGTASALGGGKFANGAYTAAFQHLLNMEFATNLDVNSPNFGKPDPAAGVNFGPPTDPYTPFFIESVVGGGIAKGVISGAGFLFRGIAGKFTAGTAGIAAGLARRLQFGHNWGTASLEKAIERHLGNSVTSWTTATRKMIYESAKTGRQIVVDLDGRYFRIFQPKKFGSMNGKYLDLLGRPMANDSKGQMMTHFLIE